MLWERSDPFGRELAAECEAFLAGRYVEHLVDAGQPIPNWAWTNLLAHGTVEQLADPPLLGVGPRNRLWAWSQGRAFMAGEVLDHARSYPSLLELQRTVLVPLELDLASVPAICELGPTSWISVLQARAARRHRSRSDHPRTDQPHPEP